MRLRRILSLDGGGIRGLVSCRWLESVERALAAAGKPGLTRSFDLFAGSSTGAIIACGVGLGMSPATMALQRSEREDAEALVLPGASGRGLAAPLRRAYRRHATTPAALRRCCSRCSVTPGWAT